MLDYVSTSPNLDRKIKNEPRKKMLDVTTCSPSPVQSNPLSTALPSNQFLFFIFYFLFFIFYFLNLLISFLQLFAFQISSAVAVQILRINCLISSWYLFFLSVSRSINTRIIIPCTKCIIIFITKEFFIYYISFENRFMYTHPDLHSITNCQKRKENFSNSF